MSCHTKRPSRAPISPIILAWWRLAGETRRSASLVLAERCQKVAKRRPNQLHRTILASTRTVADLWNATADRPRTRLNKSLKIITTVIIISAKQRLLCWAISRRTVSTLTQVSPTDRRGWQSHWLHCLCDRAEFGTEMEKVDRKQWAERRRRDVPCFLG